MVQRLPEGSRFLVYYLFCEILNVNQNIIIMIKKSLLFNEEEFLKNTGLGPYGKSPDIIPGAFDPKKEIITEESLSIAEKLFRWVTSPRLFRHKCKWKVDENNSGIRHVPIENAINHNT